MKTTFKEPFLTKQLNAAFCLSRRVLWYAVIWGVWILRLTTSWEEKQVSWEDAAGTPESSAIQEVDHVTHSMARGVEGPKLQPCPDIYDILVRQRAKQPGQSA